MSSSFGRPILAERERLAIRQWDAAELLGVSVRTVKSWENDDSPPKAIWQVGALAILRAIPERIGTKGGSGLKSPVNEPESVRDEAIEPAPIQPQVKPAPIPADPAPVEPVDEPRAW